MTESGVKAVNIHVQGVDTAEEEDKINAQNRSKRAFYAVAFPDGSSGRLQPRYKKDKFIREYLSKSNQLDYFNRLFDFVVNNLDKIDEKLEGFSDNWKVSRMAKVDLAILRLSAAEILFLEDIPDLRGSTWC